MARRHHNDRWAPEREKHRRARELRRAATEAERALWAVLRDRQIAGHKFRRQMPIGPYIADFCCVERRVVIEVDGGYHEADEQRRYDAERDAVLAAAGYQVLRFANTEVLDNLPAVVARLRAALGEGGECSQV